MESGKLTSIERKPQIIDVAPPSENLMGRCSACGGECCNCVVCVKAKGRVNICGPCARGNAGSAA